MPQLIPWGTGSCYLLPCVRERELVDRDYYSKWRNVSVFWISNFEKKFKTKALILHQVQLGNQNREGCLYFFAYI